MRLQCFYDYTCGYSFRMWRWLEEQVRPAHPDVEIEWSGFSLKEVNRRDGESVFQAREEPRLSVLALALAVAARSIAFSEYHSRAFEAFHGADSRVTRDDLLEIARTAGVDTDAFWRERASWIGTVASEHATAVERWGVFGTPTLVLGHSAAYLKMRQVPASLAEGSRLWGAIETLVVSFPDLVEIKLTDPAAPQP